MKTVTCDYCGNLISAEKTGLVNVDMGFCFFKKGNDKKVSYGECDFHPECFRQCFNTFINIDHKCFTDLKEGDEQNEKLSSSDMVE